MLTRTKRWPNGRRFFLATLLKTDKVVRPKRAERYAQKGHTVRPKGADRYAQKVPTATPKRCRAVRPKGADPIQYRIEKYIIEKYRIEKYRSELHIAHVREVQIQKNFCILEPKLKSSVYLCVKQTACDCLLPIARFGFPP
jgi:hypothetical protein